MENQNVEKRGLIPIDNLLKKSLDIYKIIFGQFIKMSLLGFLAFAPLILVITLYALVSAKVPDGSTARMILNITLVLLGILSTIFGAVLGYIAQVGLSLIIWKRDAKLKTKEALKMAKKKAWRFFYTNILAGLIILLGFLLLIIPGIIWAVYYTFVSWIILREGLSGMKAIRRSKYLVKGYWWPVAGRFLLLTVIMWFVFGFLSAPNAFMADEGTMESIYNIFLQIAQMVAAPFSLAYSYYIYRDLVDIKDKKE